MKRPSETAPAFRQGMTGVLLAGACACLPGIATAQTQQAAERDEFFWLGEINKASIVINSEEGLPDTELASEIGKALEAVIANGNAPDAERPGTVITFEPLLIEQGGVEVTLIHAGRSSQDMHATYRAAMLRDGMLNLARQLIAGPVDRRRT